MPTKVYKVVFETNYNNKSQITSVFAEGWLLKRYDLKNKNHPEKWLKDKGYWLLAFKTLKAAKKFLVGSSCYGESFAIYKAEADKIKSVLPNRSSELYHTKVDFRPELFVASWPIGTIMVDGLRLIEKVK
jgi:hypothetical protein